MPERSLELKQYLTKLRKVGVAVGAQLDGDNANEPQKEEVDMSGWSEYEKGRYLVTQRMSEIREDLTLVHELEKGGDVTKKAAVSNRLRKNMRVMKTDASQLKPEAERAKKLEEYDELIVHMKKTEKLYNQRFRPKAVRDDDDGLGGLCGGFDAGREMRSITELTDPSNPQGDLTESLLDPAEDEEFQMFFQAMHKRDEEIDQRLDQVHAGVQRLKVHAQGFQETVEVQNRQLDSMQEKVEKHTEQMQNLNTRLKDTLKEVNKDKYCCYMICLLLVLGVLGVIVTQTGVF